MKKHALLFIVSFFITLQASAQVYIYTSSGNRVYFNNVSKFVVGITDFCDSLQLNNFFDEMVKGDMEAQALTRRLFMTNLAIENINAISFRIGCQISISNVYSKDDDLFWETNRIFVKPKANQNIESILRNVKIQYDSIHQFGSDEKVYIVKLHDNNAIFASNTLYENGEVVFAQPDWGMLTTPSSVTFNNQWNLHNIEYGYDINVIDAWQLSTGENIKVAVVDEGIELTHSFLSNNMMQGYDATDGALGGAGGSNKAGDWHGTCCAGIIAANGTSSNDIKGIAYDAQIIPVRIAYRQLSQPYYWISYTSWKADGLSYAWHNADVINNSWSSSSDESAVIEIEINQAIEYGRGGKGCVVTFTTGNRNREDVPLTARFKGVISVGAMSPCGERKSERSCDNDMSWGSNYGEGLKIVAPGVFIPTTSENNTIVDNFGGTSAACPHIAAVSALLLSLNPSLTCKEVDSIICSSAEKIGDYQYDSTYNYPYGEWNMEMGYGLINAGAALQSVYDGLDKPDIYVRDNGNDNGSEPNYSTLNHTSSPDIQVTAVNGARITHIEEGGNYIVTVRLHNDDTIAPTLNTRVKLNWARVSNNLNWSQAWFGTRQRPCFIQRSGFIGSQTITEPIGAGENGVVSFSWTAPSDPTDLPHCPVRRFIGGLSYALLARVEDGHETIGEDMNDYNICDFVLQNNNVAMKTYNNLQENIRDNVVAVDMSRDRGDGIVRVVYSSTSNGSGTHISDVANVYLQFDSSMLASWPIETRQLTGCRQVNDSVFVITDTTATFDGFLLDTAETYFISSYVRYRIPQADSTEHRFSLNFSIVDGDSVFADGDIDYTVMYDEAAYFNVTAYEDMTVMAGETFELSAEADAADATFEWYNMQDVLIGTGDHISLSTITTQQYYVRGYSPSDNTVGYDTVMVTVKHGIITKITPNPAKNQVLVKYTLADDVTNPTISLRNSYGMVVYSASVGTHPAQCHINIKTIDVVPLPTGNYTVSLEDNGVVLDSKTLVVQ